MSSLWTRLFIRLKVLAFRLAFGFSWRYLIKFKEVFLELYFKNYIFYDMILLVVQFSICSLIFMYVLGFLYSSTVHVLIWQYYGYIIFNIWYINIVKTLTKKLECLNEEKIHKDEESIVERLKEREWAKILKEPSTEQRMAS